jgi:uncharacterized protein
MAKTYDGTGQQSVSAIQQKSEINMEKNLIIKQTENYVKEILFSDTTGHDWWHVNRVWRIAINIGKHESVDMFIVELAALLHDIADFKLHGGDETIGPRMAREWLEGFEIDVPTIAHVVEIIQTMSFKGASVDATMKTKEGMVVQDADRLDALGAIGIGRTFTFGGHRGHPMYDPRVKPKYHQTFEQYKNNTSPTINHFYEKLLLLKDLMNTRTARKIAEDRHRFMEQFLERFLIEWDGKDLVE